MSLVNCPLGGHPTYPVSFVSAPPAKHLAAVLAPVRPPARVALHVLAEVVGVVEGGIALVALEDVLAPVGHDVVPQVGLSAEGRPTLVADEEALAVVGAHVAFEVTGLQEGGAALLAQVGAVQLVGHHVAPKVTRLHEGGVALVAHVGLLTFVTLQVQLKVVHAQEGVAALRAHVGLAVLLVLLLWTLLACALLPRRPLLAHLLLLASLPWCLEDSGKMEMRSHSHVEVKFFSGKSACAKFSVLSALSCRVCALQISSIIIKDFVD